MADAPNPGAAAKVSSVSFIMASARRWLDDATRAADSNRSERSTSTPTEGDADGAVEYAPALLLPLPVDPPYSKQAIRGG